MPDDIEQCVSGYASSENDLIDLLVGHDSVPLDFIEFHRLIIHWVATF